MKNLSRILLCAALLATAFVARAERTFNQAELDALLAPVALYPDGVLSNILVAASYPEDVREAAAWSRGNPQLRGDEALRAVEYTPWQPSVKALAATPEVLLRMDESPTWMRDLGDAYRVHGPYVMDTVQSLRRRAQASGNLYSDNERRVYEDEGALVVAPAAPHVVYVRYYDPYVVYGPWWWPAYRPVLWRPWPVYGSFISIGFVASHADWHHRRVVVVNRPTYVVNRTVVQRPVVVQRQVVVQRPVQHTTVRQLEHRNAPQQRQVQQQQYHRVPESQRQPIVQQHHQQQRGQTAALRQSAPARHQDRGQHRGNDRRH
jgi:hypothetical protein